MSIPGRHQLGSKESHSTVLVDDKLYLWGGYEDGLPSVHDSEEKKSMTKKVNSLNLSTLEWHETDSIGEPPFAVMDYRTAVIGDDIYFFGGRCGNNSCCHNSLHSFNTRSKEWQNIDCTQGPMEKYSCGFIAYSDHDSHLLLAIGGRGKKLAPFPEGSDYISYDNDYFTNEIHIMDTTKSLGEWKIPSVQGQRPPPIAWFSLDVLPSSNQTIAKAVLFGGYILTEKNKGQTSNDVYILTLSEDTVSFSKVSHSCTMLQCPKPRDSHSSCLLISTSTSGETTSHLCIMGGSDGRTVGDCWTLNLTTKTWIKIPLPETVCERESHSISSSIVDKNVQWIIVVGGEKGYSHISGVHVTVVIELVYLTSLKLWVVRKLWDFERNWTESEEWSALQKEITQLSKDHVMSVHSVAISTKNTEMTEKIPTEKEREYNNLPQSRDHMSLQKTSRSSSQELSGEATIRKEKREDQTGQKNVIPAQEEEMDQEPADKNEEQNVSKAVKLIREAMDRNHASLSNLFEDSIKEVAEEMLSAGIISRIKMKEPSSDTILNSFDVGLNFKKTVQEIEDHCKKFLSVFYEFGGPFSDAAQSIAAQIEESVGKSINIQLHLRKEH